MLARRGHEDCRQFSGPRHRSNYYTKWQRPPKGRKCLLLAVRPEGANHLWRKNPPRELSIDLVADEPLGRVVYAALTMILGGNDEAASMIAMSAFRLREADTRGKA
jgi:hypothetical protein